MPSMNRYQDDVLERVWEAIDEDEAKPFEDIESQVDHQNEGETREALLDLVDSNQVIVNSQWNYRRR